MLCKIKPENELKHKLLAVDILKSQHVPWLSFGSCQPALPNRTMLIAWLYHSQKAVQTRQSMVWFSPNSQRKVQTLKCLSITSFILGYAKHALLP